MLSALQNRHVFLFASFVIAGSLICIIMFLGKVSQRDTLFYLLGELPDHLKFILGTMIRISPDRVDDMSFDKMDTFVFNFVSTVEQEIRK